MVDLVRFGRVLGVFDGISAWATGQIGLPLIPFLLLHQ